MTDSSGLRRPPAGSGGFGGLRRPPVGSAGLGWDSSGTWAGLEWDSGGTQVGLRGLLVGLQAGLGRTPGGLGGLGWNGVAQADPAGLRTRADSGKAIVESSINMKRLIDIIQAHDEKISVVQSQLAKIVDVLKQKDTNNMEEALVQEYMVGVDWNFCTAFAILANNHGGG
ncbi:hypothetical protein H6P81_019008 [Aristolochia fimbriata]|uniref:Uncharacterized protein n=1 Tax=Aristolochia fimbriata TaxID=158543 RepID=A0AAV7E4P1_ARIFI|nr:hypothetical protein H6P81_019008 [Aristolochia fimbriata]